MNNTIQIANNEGNRKHLTNIGIAYEEKGRYLVISVAGHHAALINSGQMSKAEYKKNILCI